jgi:RNA polymerase sigma factor (sigma-70 family)
MAFLQDEKEHDTRDTKKLHEGCMHTKLVNNLEVLLATARPRLAHIARTHGIPPDGVDDVVQETLVEGWQHLESLRTPEHFDAWLNGICRNVSLHWMRVQGTTERRQRPFSSLFSEGGGGEDTDSAMLEPVDSQMLDLAEDLNRQDLAVLLDRAMGHLPVSTRKALELHYLAEMPQREVALHLGMTINALEVKLHRARRQLREILNGPLRTDAASFGLALEQEAAQGWRESRLWCPCCGRQRLQGIFMPMPGGDDASLRMRCPNCCARDDNDLINTFNAVSFKDRRSFRPAIKRVLQMTPDFFTQILTTKYQRCPFCNGMAQLRGIEKSLLPGPFQHHFCLILECSSCHGKIQSAIMLLFQSYPQVYQFTTQHERCVIEPELAIEYEGQPAFRISLTHLLSSAQLTLIVHGSTLDLLATFEK